MCSQPQRKPGNLSCTWVDIDPVDVVFDDQARHFAEERRIVCEGSDECDEGREGSSGFRRGIQAVRHFPCLVVDDAEEVKGIQAEVHGPARRVDHADFARVFEMPMRDVDGLPKQVFLRAVVSGRGQCRGCLAFGEKNLVRPADKVAALVLQTRLPLRHLIPDAAEGVVGEELDDVARGEKLVTDSQLAAVAWRGGLLAHLLPLLWVIVILIDPPDRLVLSPYARQFRRVELGERGFECLASRPELGGGIRAVEEDAHFAADFVEETFEVKPVALVGQFDQAGSEAGELLEALGLVTLRDARQHQGTRLHHLQCRQTIEEGEHPFGLKATYRLRRRLSDGQTMLNGFDNAAPYQPLRGRQLGPRLPSDPTIGMDIERALQL